MSPVTHWTLEDVVNELENRAERWISKLGFYVAWSYLELHSIKIECTGGRVMCAKKQGFS